MLKNPKGASQGVACCMRVCEKCAWLGTSAVLASLTAYACLEAFTWIPGVCTLLYYELIPHNNFTDAYTILAAVNFTATRSQSVSNHIVALYDGELQPYAVANATMQVWPEDETRHCRIRGTRFMTDSEYSALGWHILFVCLTVLGCSVCVLSVCVLCRLVFPLDERTRQRKQNKMV